uniref:Ribosomal protein L33 n=1 Tax=Pterospora andromedea TaxID=4349 RepID=A0A221SRD3_PTEAN|nr:ribosomal protein L33 [Pterospora andromedea]
MSKGKSKDVRVTVILECTSCIRNGINKGIFRYITKKNRNKTPQQLKLKKFCPYCCKHTIQEEITK